ncbi:hypothetical protein DFQ29_000905 [Apophysomyces sp. BC1021]|nr:hypothetical protein DFQ29_000905 [Apophysomyces sp. BC1021]
MPHLRLGTALLENLHSTGKEKGNKVTTFPGEEELESMTKQQEKQGLKDSRHKYKADGVALSAFNAATEEKASFDHYKAMMKSLSDKYRYALLKHSSNRSCILFTYMVPLSDGGQ